MVVIIWNTVVAFLKMCFENIYDLDEYRQFGPIGRVNISRRKECPSCYIMFVKEENRHFLQYMGKLGNVHYTNIRVLDVESFLEAECDLMLLLKVTLGVYPVLFSFELDY